MNKEEYIALVRFGLGASAVDLHGMFTPRDWLLQQVSQPENTPDFAELTGTQANLARLMEARQSGNKELAKEIQKGFKDVYLNEMRTRIWHAIRTPTPFYERLVNFWSNHFTVSVKKGGEGHLAVSYEREAIRPNITGRFADMLQAVTHHPAMQVYLDNAQSIGPDSRAGQRNGKGLNENLAREIMELHTLGVNGGYTQADVTTFAKVLTGWTVGNGKGGTAAGVFTFVPNRHQPGPETLLGKTYADTGERQGMDVLNDLAAHPATARHIATKLARHFISDDPPEEAVAALADAFSKSGGNLADVYRTLVELPQPWSLDNVKIKSSYDLVISAGRLCLSNADMNFYLNSLRFLGDVPFTADSPAGFPDTARDVAGPDNVLRRIEWAQGAAGKLLTDKSYTDLGTFAIGLISSNDTVNILNSARSQKEGLALLLASPEFQRR